MAEGETFLAAAGLDEGALLRREAGLAVEDVFMWRYNDALI